MYKKYKQYIIKGKQQKNFSKSRFSREKMEELVDSLLLACIPDFPQEQQLKLPTLNLPKLEKIG